ncbi:MAG: glutathione S-transferase C-terminal domain-containing protein [Devosiaceae bacterium]|nr:glutathione S-transferase C-terminal domain-containing protein [Devosiaceae bacterium MH13]
MGMLIEGRWHDDADRSMQDGAYRRETSALPDQIDSQLISQLRDSPGRYVLVASASCPWSHGAVLAHLFKGFAPALAIHWAGGPRVEGYALKPEGPLAPLGWLHMHQLYTATDPAYTGRSTVPALWDAEANQIVSNESAAIMRAFDEAGTGPRLFPDALEKELSAFLPWLFEGLSNAVYRAGKAQRQDEYEEATASVYATLEALEVRLTDRPYLFGEALTAPDLRLFATLVRYDTVYATHFRCTRYRLVDFPALWRFTRRLFQMPGVAETMDFDEIRRGYYLNDGAHNPFGLVGDQPKIDWWDRTGLS